LKKWFEKNGLNNDIEILTIINDYKSYYDENYLYYGNNLEPNFGDNDDKEISFVYKYIKEKNGKDNQISTNL